MKKTKIAVFASGTGSNFDTIVRERKAGHLNVEVCLLVCDKPEALVVEKASQYGIPTFAFEAKSYENKEGFEREIEKQLKKLEVEWVILAGYMRLIGPTLLQAYPNRMINIHPSLLPAFPGKDAIGQAFDAGVKVTGVTVHFVDEGMDTGQIIDQEALRILDSDDRDSLQKRVQEVEHRLFPATIQKLISERGNQNEKKSTH
ncbi:phosphoribosylglycinamide formyltransferase [Radiobacillus kanasensis]|uniref:phosphoribosylglycinamide formyltransferase n=1 Tax=Radiobacillus kanasensis TaxID=2844358 RepID=UPI001E4F1321|nr:phosphoribosylglycinamide formyltransferase [Radiobacillus kanasensis]UFT99914.1 phosphoribosylglycinamide formyltransferase [Radiobacillus kanasensis]